MSRVLNVLAHATSLIALSALIREARDQQIQIDALRLRAGRLEGRLDRPDALATEISKRFAARTATIYYPNATGTTWTWPS